MPLALKSSGGGSVTLDTPVTASTFTLTVPALTATVITDSSGVLNIGSGQLYKDASGNFGVGTSSLTYRVTVGGYGQETAALTDAGNKGASIYLRADAVGVGSGGAVLFGTTFGNATPFAAIKALIADGGSNTRGDLAFSTRNATTDTALTERMRIDSGGTLLLGQTTNPATGTMVLKVPTGTGNGINAQITNNTGTSYPFSNYNATGTYVGGISCTSSATAFPTSSDYRLKQNITPMTGALDRISALKPVTYQWKIDETDSEGFIAHQLQEVIPQSVFGKKDEVNEDGSIKPQSVDYSKIVVHLVAAIQELKTDLDAAKAEIAALKGNA
jgi:hypothetical protein